MERHKPHENHDILSLSTIGPRFFKAAPNGIAAIRFPRPAAARSPRHVTMQIRCMRRRREQSARKPRDYPARKPHDYPARKPPDYPARKPRDYMSVGMPGANPVIACVFAGSPRITETPPYTVAARSPRLVAARSPRLVVGRSPRLVVGRSPRLVVARSPRLVGARSPRLVGARSPRHASGFRGLPQGQTKLGLPV